MKTLRAFLCIAALLVAFATQGARADDSDSVGPVGSGPIGSVDSNGPVQVAQAEGSDQTGGSAQVDDGGQPVTRADLRHTENSIRAEIREIRETIRWLIVALIAVLGLPQLSAMWERHRRNGGNGKGLSSAVSLALGLAPYILGAFAIAAAVAG